MQFEFDDIWTDVHHSAEADRLIKRREYRLKTIGIVAASYALDTLLLFFFAYNAMIDTIVYIVYGSLGALQVTLFGALHWFGISERLKNPHMTSLQMIYALMMQLVGMALAPQILTFFMAIIFIIFAFGVMRMSLKQALGMWLMTIFAVLATLEAIAPRTVFLPQPGAKEMLLILISFSTILLRAILLGYYSMLLRTRMLQQTRKYEHLAHTDPLTGCMNRRAILDFYDEQLHIYHRKQIPFCVAMLDIDHFKPINDTFGHALGDQVLKMLVEIIAGSVRLSDKVGRYGGEEFLLVLPATEIGEAYAMMERVRLSIESHNWKPLTHPLAVTVSIGLFEITPEAQQTEPIRHADTALYDAKNSGRNLTMIYTEDKAAK